MLLSRRSSSCAALHRRLATAALLHTRYRVHATDNEGVVSDDALTMRAFARKGRLARASVTVLLDGRARLGDGTRRTWMEPGAVVLLPQKTRAAMRQEAAPLYRSVALELDAGTLVDPPRALVHVRGSAELVAAALALWTAMIERDEPVERHAALLRALLDALAPHVRTKPFDLVEPVPDAMREVSNALDRALSFIDAQPMHVDLEDAMGLSARQVARRVEELNERYGFNAGTWRDTRNRRRLMTALVFLSVEGATVREVADAVGYRSDAALCHAFANAGLPAPAEIASQIAALGADVA